MTLYAGEIIRIRTTATDPDGNNITDILVTSTELVIVDSDLNTVVDVPLVWEATELYWFYDWDTPDTEDSFVSRIRLVTSDFDMWEYQKIKTKANKDGFITPP